MFVLEQLDKRVRSRHERDRVATAVGDELAPAVLVSFQVPPQSALLGERDNDRHDEDVYHRRSIVEAIFSALKHRFGETLRARTWFGQFRELVLKAAVRNVEQAVKL